MVCVCGRLAASGSIIDHVCFVSFSAFSFNRHLCDKKAVRTSSEKENMKNNKEGMMQ